MYFADDALLPETQDELIITAAPYGPEWAPSDFPEDIPVTMEEQVQKAVDCYNAGATVLHVHVRELDGKGSKRLSMFNELLAGIRARVPEMVLQVGGSISFSPEGEGDQAKWLGYDTRHLLAELEPKPDQVTIAINTVQMNITELMTPDDARGTQFENPAVCKAWSDMVVDATPTFYLEHLKRLREKDIQVYFMLANTAQLETVERLIRRGQYMGPLNHCYVAIGGGASGPDPYAMMDYIRRSPQGGVLQIEGIMRNGPPMMAMAIAMGLHVRVGIEDNIWRRKGERFTSVAQVEQMVRMARELGRDVATAKDARRILKIGTWYDTPDQTLAALGMTPNRKPGQRGFLVG
ncbi:MAG: 3-keto-5-aminohexanoate cleavage protein [Steroidobacteraceae bacterium]